MDVPQANMPIGSSYLLIYFHYTCSFHSLFHSRFRVCQLTLDNLLSTLSSTLNILDDRAVLHSALVEEDTGDLGATSEEEEEVDGSKAIRWSVNT
jgi:hypothetical protein